jgi:hypothetical protein
VEPPSEVEESDVGATVVKTKESCAHPREALRHGGPQLAPAGRAVRRVPQAPCLLWENRRGF